MEYLAESRDVALLFATRLLRMLSYGSLSVVLLKRLSTAGLSWAEVGSLLTLILFGDLGITLYLAVHADTRFGRRRTLIAGALLKAAAGFMFAFCDSYWALALAGTIGIISLSGGEIGPFQAIEQSGLTDAVCRLQAAEAGGGGSSRAEGGDNLTTRVSRVFGLYNALGWAAQAAGGLLAGAAVSFMTRPAAAPGSSDDALPLLSSWQGMSPAEAYRVIVASYGVMGLAKAGIYLLMSAAVEPGSTGPAPAAAPAPAPAVDDEEKQDDDTAPAVAAAGTGAVAAPVGIGGAVGTGGAAVAKPGVQPEADDDEVEGEALLPQGSSRPGTLARVVEAQATKPAARARVDMDDEDGEGSSAGSWRRRLCRCWPAGLSSVALAGKLGLHRPTTLFVLSRLCALFLLDSFAGGFVMQSVLAVYFTRRWGMSEAGVGALLMGCNVIAGGMSLGASALVRRWGSIRTMVFTHAPSNLLLLGVPLMPTREAAIALLLLRFSLSQLDVPARQAFVATVVDADERSAAGGITNIVRSLGLAAAPPLLSHFLADADATSVRFAAIFFVAGGLKLLYDGLVLLVLGAMDKPAAAAAGRGGAGGSGSPAPAGATAARRP